MSDMKNLLEKWATLEPQLCEDLYGQTIRLHLSDDSSFSIHPLINELPIKEMAMIQWAIQQAIVEKGWYFKLNNFLNDKGFAAKIISDINKEEVTLTISSNPTEALLAAYLKALDA